MLEKEVFCGNAAAEGKESWGWFLGGFFPPELPKHSSKVEIKWGIHKAGEARTEWGADEKKTTLTVLISGQIVQEFENSDEALLSEPGDFCQFGPNISHKWRVLEDTTIITFRWVE